MKEYTVEIEIDAEGNLHAETKGMQGEVCVSELGDILAGVAGKRDIKNTSDYYKKPVARQTIKTGR